MASISSDNWNSFPYTGMELDGMEISETDAALLMTLLEESHVEEVEDGKLKSVIQSLEAEIGRSDEDAIWDDIGDCSSSCMFDMYDSFDWIDTEMASTSPNDDGMGNWYAYSVENELVGMTNFENTGSNNIDDFASLPTFKDIADFSQFVYEDDQSYCTLWQETYCSSMYS
ncbi:hypothetical protein AQUCO_02200193v1 [Aquilegia coerulea]|uniref:Uncharacterized protein n=1 Tax=Aquilegia coerulea TaxID=218851 RepID=A0A2G5DDH4_AQUCA|nr:hypothetical protein AQUCO_02200193v1 [Aquilegia coerulea]